MKPCEICSGNQWVKADKSWFRCVICGHLEQHTKTRKCAKCGVKLGKYAKPKTSLCIECKRVTTASRIRRCQTPECMARIDSSGAQYCAQCELERATWGLSPKIQWRTSAIKLLKQGQILRFALLKKLQGEAPSLTESILATWLNRRVKLGAVKRLNRNTYMYNR